jgi:hypothetical protein
VFEVFAVRSTTILGPTFLPMRTAYKVPARNVMLSTHLKKVLKFIPGMLALNLLRPGGAQAQGQYFVYVCKYRVEITSNLENKSGSMDIVLENRYPRSQI